MPDMHKNIAEYGEAAIIKYYKDKQPGNDNEVPEHIINKGIADRIRQELGLTVYTERSYQKMAIELGAQDNKELTDAMGGWLADIAIYEGERPIAVIETKIHDEGARQEKVRHDLNKMRKISEVAPLQTYFAALITDTIGTSCKQRLEKLEDLLGSKFYRAELPQKANGGTADWYWQFACVHVVHDRTQPDR